MTTQTRAAIDSVPVLAAAIRTTGHNVFALPTGIPLNDHTLVPMYRVRNTSLENEVSDAIQLIEQITERLRRLANAYGAWPEFDASPYFDLTEKQAQALVKVTERVSTVHVLFRTDLLLPAFRRASAYWAGHFVTAHAVLQSGYHDTSPSIAFDDDFLLETQPMMKAHWQRLLAIVEEVRITLADDPAYLGMSAAHEAQMGLRRFWTTPPAYGIDPALTPELVRVPTLTLSFDFPLPAHRQSGRVRRLRLNRDRRRKRSGRGDFREN